MSTQTLQHCTPTVAGPKGEAVRITLLENDEVLVLSTTYPPGASIPMHTHRFPRVICVVEGGIIETTLPDGTAQVYDVRPGEALWSAATDAHSARNTGSTTVRHLEVEVKHAAPAGHVPQNAVRVLPAASLEWTEDTIDPRRKAAFMIGDPLRTGPYTIRYRAPAGYEIGLHMHPDDDEQLTVLSGVIVWSIGEAGSGAPEHRLAAGGFAAAPAGTPHRILVLEDAVLQMSGIGPRTYVYLPGSEGREAM